MLAFYVLLACYLVTLVVSASAVIEGEAGVCWDALSFQELHSVLEVATLTAKIELIAA